MIERRILADTDKMRVTVWRNSSGVYQLNVDDKERGTNVSCKVDPLELVEVLQELAKKEG